MSRDDEGSAGEYVARCACCGTWRVGRDCYLACVAKGYVEPPRMVNLKGREHELCRHESEDVDYIVGLGAYNNAVCGACGNDVAPADAVMSPNEQLIGQMVRDPDYGFALARAAAHFGLLALARA